MKNQDGAARHEGPHFWRHLLIGFFTLAPLWVTWLVFDFAYRLLARTGTPMLKAAAAAVRPLSVTLADWLLNPTVQVGLAATLTVACLYLTGLLASLVIGRRVIAHVEGLMARLPLIQSVYGATKRFLETVRNPPLKGQRVVLISFPTSSMKAVGFVTRVIQDQDTGIDLAVVYVPTSPNPTSGYIEILPMSDVVQTDWSMEEAMTFVMTGGTNSPDTVRFRNAAEG
jgi:uncharacterized membrane protein